MIRCAFFEMKRLPSRVTPRWTSDSISSMSEPGSTTTPQPTTQRQPRWRMPEGIDWRTYFTPHVDVVDLALPRDAPLRPDDHAASHRRHPRRRVPPPQPAPTPTGPPRRRGAAPA